MSYHNNPYHQDTDVEVLEENASGKYYTKEVAFDILDEKLITHFGEEYRKLANARRERRNASGLWNFRKL